jgi:4-amino-4-deoxy-L-arabinose transferase-like glycosyltransferase
MTSAARIFWFTIAVTLFVSRAAHTQILWADEDYHLAEAVQILHGKMLYRDVWYDKPPLTAWLMTLFGAWPGWPLRIVSTLLELASALVAYRFASQLWSSREGYVAAGLCAFFAIFYHAHTVIPVEPDSIMILPQLLAVYFAWRGRSTVAGALAGVCFLLNTKGLFVLAACLVLNPSGWMSTLWGFCGPCLLGRNWLIFTGAWNDYLEQVWRWGFLYARHPPPESALAPLARFASWQAFHAALWIGAIAAWSRIERRDVRRKLALWLAISLVAASIGWRFSPRYFDQVIPPLIILGAFGVTALWRGPRVWRWILIVAFVIPLIRFGPRYVELIADDLRGQKHEWRDITMDQESRDAAEKLRGIARPGDTIFVWGYRPNVVVYSRLPVADQLWDSQPVTMVPADRHLGASTPLDDKWAIENQKKLIQTSPSILVDGLSAYNPDLDLHAFPMLANWFGQYCRISTASSGITIYRRCDEVNSAPRN